MTSVTTMSPPVSGWTTRFLERQLARRLPRGDRLAFEVVLPDGRSIASGDGRLAATVVVRTRAGLIALASMDGTRMAEAYRAGALDVEGDLQALLALRDAFADRHPLTSAWRFLRPRLFGQVASDAHWIALHYEHHPDFYLAFLDRRHRCYSQAIFTDADEPLESAVSRKLDFAIAAIGAREGDHVLDIGGGWGAFTEHAGRRGIRVTSLTISADSERFIAALIRDQGLPCRVLREHLFEHVPDRRYDGIVNLGVTEHLPDYARTLAKYRELLKPGGRIYLDASASRERYDLSAFLLRHIYPGNGSLLCLADYLRALGRTPFELLELHNDREHYVHTSRHWARNLDASRDEIVRRWGEPLYRTFRLYLWGCVDGFARDMLQAYRFVLRLPA